LYVPRECECRWPDCPVILGSDGTVDHAGNILIGPSFIKKNISRLLRAVCRSSLFIEPDFIFGENPVKPYIKMMVDNKRNTISMKPYLFCTDCLNRDFDIVAGSKKFI